MKKYISALLIFLLLAVMSAGCGGGENKNLVSCRDILETVKESTEEGFDTVYAMGDKEYKDNFDFMYGITWDMIDDGGIIFTEEGGLADEISIVHLKDQKDISLAKDKFTDRLEDRRNTFSGYKPEEVYKLDNARIIVQGSYVALIIAEDAGAMETLIRDAVTNG